MTFEHRHENKSCSACQEWVNERMKVVKVVKVVKVKECEFSSFKTFLVPSFCLTFRHFFGTIVIQKWTKLGEDWGEICPESVNKYRFQSNKIEYIFVEAIN